jgi:hypothetical protein
MLSAWSPASMPNQARLGGMELQAGAAARVQLEHGRVDLPLRLLLPHLAPPAQRAPQQLLIKAPLRHAWAAQHCMTSLLLSSSSLHEISLKDSSAALHESILPHSSSALQSMVCWTAGPRSAPAAALALANAGQHAVWGEPRRTGGRAAQLWGYPVWACHLQGTACLSHQALCAVLGTACWGKGAVRAVVCPVFLHR